MDDDAPKPGEIFTVIDGKRVSARSIADAMFGKAPDMPKSNPPEADSASAATSFAFSNTPEQKPTYEYYTEREMVLPRDAAGIMSARERDDTLLDAGAEPEPIQASTQTAEDAGYDASDFETVTETDAETRHLDALATRFVALTTEIETMGETLAAKKAELQELSRNTLAEVFTTRKLTEYVAPSGQRLVLTEECHASVRKDDRERAAAWLEQNGYGAILTHEFTIKLPSKSETIAMRMAKFLHQCLPTESFKIELTPSVEHLRGVLHQMLNEIAPGRKLDYRLSWSGSSLAKIVRDRRKAGAPVPEWLGYFDPATVQLADEPLVTE